jgi:hypothetical protein
MSRNRILANGPGCKSSFEIRFVVKAGRTPTHASTLKRNKNISRIKRTLQKQKEPVTDLSQQRGSTGGAKMRFDNWAHTALVTALMGSSVAAATFSTTARAADFAADQSASVAADSKSVPPAVVTVGPVYAFGPVIESQRQRTPRQRSGEADWSRRRNNGSSPPRYSDYQAQRGFRPWQAYPPRSTWNSQTSNPYRYGYQRPWPPADTRNTLAWFDPPYRRNGDQSRYRQPYWRY